MGFRAIWPNSLFKSRLHLSCRDLIHVATSISCRDIDLEFCILELVFHVVTTPIYAFESLCCLLMMSRHHDLVATSTIVPCNLQWLLLMSRHRSPVMTSPNAFASLNWKLLMSRHHDVVTTTAQVSGTLPLVVVMSRPLFSCRDINFMNCCFERVSSGVVTSTSCRDINSWLRSLQLMSS